MVRWRSELICVPSSRLLTRTGLPQFNWLKEQRALSAEQARTIQNLQAEKDRLNRATNVFTERQRTRYAALREEKKTNEGQRTELLAKISELEVSEQGGHCCHGRISEADSLSLRPSGATGCQVPG